jgi:hypothetical protein
MEILDFKEFKKSKQKTFEVGWSIGHTSILHRTTALAMNREDAATKFRSWLSNDDNLNIEYIVEDTSLKRFLVTLGDEQGYGTGPVLAHSEIDARAIVADRYPQYEIFEIYEDLGNK